VSPPEYIFHSDHANLITAARDPCSQELMNRAQRNSYTPEVLLNNLVVVVPLEDTAIVAVEAICARVLSPMVGCTSVPE